MGTEALAKDLTVVIPVHNRRLLTRTCLDCLGRQTVNEFRIVVVDDGSTDGTYAMLVDEYPEVWTIRGDGDLWWSAATNLGVERALRTGALWVLTLNDDTEPEPGFVEEMLKAASAREASLYGAYAIDATTGAPVNGGERMRWLSASKTSLLDVVPPEDRVGVYPVTHLPGRGMLIPREAFERVGLFDARRFPHSIADYDFTLRAGRAGLRLYVNFDAVLRVYPEESGGEQYYSHFSWPNYREHLFGMKGAGTVDRFVVYGWRNAPVYARIPFIVVGVARRLGGYLLRWVRQRLVGEHRG